MVLAFGVTTIHGDMALAIMIGLHSLVVDENKLQKGLYDAND